MSSKRGFRIVLYGTRIVQVLSMSGARQSIHEVDFCASAANATQERSAFPFDEARVEGKLMGCNRVCTLGLPFAI
jgi:hypothetical protein